MVANDQMRQGINTEKMKGRSRLQPPVAVIAKPLASNVVITVLVPIKASLRALWSQT